MRLNFKRTFIKGEPTAFIDKIWDALTDCSPKLTLESREKYRKLHLEQFREDWYDLPYSLPKKHSIRKLTKTRKKRWRKGLNIEFRTGSRFHPHTYFQFAPKVPVISVQDIKIKYGGHQYGGWVSVFIDGVEYETIHIYEDFSFEYTEKMQRFVQNDGFDTIVQFFDWFSKDFEGQIIHWTDLKY